MHDVENVFLGVCSVHDIVVFCLENAHIDNNLSLSGRPITVYYQLM